MEVEVGVAMRPEEMDPPMDSCLTPQTGAVEEATVPVDREDKGVELSFLKSQGFYRTMEKSVQMEPREATLQEVAVVDPLI